MPANIKDQINSALQLHQSGKLSEAENLYNEILSSQPDNASVLNLLGLLNFQQNKFEEASVYLKKALEINPCAYFYDGLGRVYQEMEKYIEAIECFKKSAELSPESFDAWFNLGLAYKKNKDFDSAIEAYENALILQPTNSSVYFNLGNLYECKNETEKAIENYEQSYKYNKDPNDTDIPYFLAICYIKAKNYEKGIPLHEYRPSKPFATLCQQVLYKEQIETKPYWDGTPMPDKTLFVYYESALGDTLMYVRYLHLLKGMFKRILFKTQSCFVDFFKENNFGVEILDSRTLPHEVVFDAHIALMSIPYVLNLNTEEIPFSEGYLKANPAKIEEYHQQFFNNDKFKIGIKWMGNTAYDLTRIIDVEAFYKIFDLPNTQFYSVQKGEGTEELEKIPEKYNIVSLGDTFSTFGDTAAAIENMDLIICNDTSVAHLAGAMGKPCWVMLPFVQNWRWHTDLSYSPWYKSAKMFKQIEPGNWDEVFDRAKVELEKLINK